MPVQTASCSYCIFRVGQSLAFEPVGIESSGLHTKGDVGGEYESKRIRDTLARMHPVHANPKKSPNNVGL